MDIINPATGETIASLDTDHQQSLDAKLAILKAGQKKWMEVPLQERIAILDRYAKLLETNLEPLAQTLTAEVGKPLQQARNEINGSRTRIAWLTANAMRYLSPETMYADDNLEETIHYEPLGVVCNISAWNYPYLVGTNVFVPALLAGNSVCYKPSEYATLTGLHIEKLLTEAK